MTTVAGEIKAVVSGAKVAADIIKRIDSSEALQARFDESIAEVHRDVGQVSYAVCKALVAHAMECDPSDDQVSDFMTKAARDPAFPHRAFRLLGEARKAASRRRRAFLAAMLFGLPFAKLPDDERDRIDMVVERIMPADVELLTLLAEKERTSKPAAQIDFFEGLDVAALTCGIDIRIVTANDYANRGFADEVEVAEVARPIDHAAFASLRSLGCVDLGDSNSSQGDWQIHDIVITPLGRLVIRAIEEVGPGIDANIGGSPAGR